MISSGLTPPEGKAPTGNPASDFLEIIREAILVGDMPGRCGTPINISGGGIAEGPPTDVSFKTLSKPPIIDSTLLKSIAIILLH
jgi:hypothetical protein